MRVIYIRLIQIKQALNQAPLAGEIGVFISLWLGQLISRLGSGLTSFALDIWVYQQTDSITQLALLTAVIALPAAAMSPFAGAIVDRWSRRWIMVVSNVLTACCILSVAVLYASDRLHIWHIYLAVAGKSTFDVFRDVAFRSSLVLMLPKDKLLFASGLAQGGNSIVRLISPALGGVLLSLLHIKGVIVLDAATVGFALLPLLLFRLPEISDIDNGITLEQKSTILAELVEGWEYLADRRGLLSLVLLRAVYNVATSAALVLTTPLLLSLTTPTNVGFVLSISATGMVVGSLLLGALDSDQSPLINIIFISMLTGGAGLICAGVRPSLTLYTCAAFFFALGIPLINGCTQVLFQRKVAPQIQGRIFSANSMIIIVAPPIVILGLGPLVDKVLEPRMAFDGPWAHTIIGELIGSGPGRGTALLMIILGIAVMIFITTAYQYEPLRFLEKQLPDQLDS